MQKVRKVVLNMQRKQRPARTVFYVTGIALLCVAAFWLGAYHRDRNIKTGEAATQDSNSLAEGSPAEAVIPTETALQTETPTDASEDTSGEHAETAAAPADTAAALSEATENQAKTTEALTENSAQTSGSEDAITYSNTQYGFDFKLPASWDGYTVQTDQWQGTAITGEHQGEVVETGDIIVIRHPDWTKENPRQDIPIMVYTLDQWKQVDDAMAVSAAPIPPLELGRNSNYVFALPARYNYAFPTGFEEVEEIMENHPLAANDNFK